MNFFKKPSSRYDDNGYVDVEAEQVVGDTVIVSEETEKRTVEPRTGSPISSGVNLGGSSIEMKVVRPEGFESRAAVADHLLSGCTVVLNLESTPKDIAKRMLDFLSGVAYSIDGQIKRIAANTYIITPNNVDVSEAASDSDDRADDSVETEE